MAKTPMMQQYLDVKAQYPDAILFFRLGDFYEMFYDDAKLVSRELELTLTGKDCGEPERAPMCGVPYHSADTYIARLVARGYKVVICEQTEDPAQAKGLVKRDVVRIVTPGTIMEGSYLDETRNNYLCALYIQSADPKTALAGICFADASTGELSATVLSGANTIQRLLTELGTYSPREVLLNMPASAIPQLEEFVRVRLNGLLESGCEERFDLDGAKRALEKSLGSLPGDPDGADDPALRAAGALLQYVAETQKCEIPYFKSVNFYHEGRYMEMDLSTRRSLELCESMRSKEKRGTLLWVLDYTRTSMGARLLRKWVEQPLLNVKTILRRQSAVAELSESYMLREELGETLRRLLDLERLMSKVVYGSAGARDLSAIAATLSAVPELKELLRDVHCDELCALRELLDPVDELCDTLRRALVDTPPFTVREGKMIRPGYSADVDRLTEIIDHGEAYIRKIEADEREKTGIKSLKIGYNRVFGYYIEITKAALAQSGREVPEHYIRKQTLANGERYISKELKELEATILGASDKNAALQYELFCQLRDQTAAQALRIQTTAESAALLDVYVSLAEAAAKNHYVRPEIEYGEGLTIREGRHPVVERFVENEYFVPNDTTLDTGHNRLMLITGPNMAGKSTYMRQVALICVMAQIGSFVPAKEASIGIVDKLFTRVGASDDLASGQSTFMLEMSEVAYILKNATSRSLIIYDEIGRGTSTFDGMSIARAVAEYTASKKIGAKTLFATHYHELTALEDEVDGVVNYSIAAKKRGDDVMFLRKIVRGGADDSYGIEVAKLAGVPKEIISRAREILRSLESRSAAIEAIDAPEKPDSDELSFEDVRKQDILRRLEGVDPELLTPIEALNLLYELKKMAK